MLYTDDAESATPCVCSERRGSPAHARRQTRWLQSWLKWLKPSRELAAHQRASGTLLRRAAHRFGPEGASKWPPLRPWRLASSS